MIRADLQHAQRWGAIGAFRLASSLLRHATLLHGQRRISNDSLRTALAGTLLLQRFRACWLWVAAEEIRIFRVNMPIDHAVDRAVSHLVAIRNELQ